MYQHRGGHVLCTLLIALSIAGIARDEEPAMTVDGPEAPHLIGDLSGYLITNNTGHITAISIPGLQTHIVRDLPSDAQGYGPNVHALSGPDQDGRIAYIENYFFVAKESEKRHLLKSVHVSGQSDHVLFTRPGDAMWALTPAGQGVVGSHLALSPTGGDVAFLSTLKNKQMPQALLFVGHIEIWNLNEKRQVDDIDANAIDEAMSWFPDGRRLAYTAFVSRKELPNDAPGLEYFSTYLGNNWDEIPAIYIYDTSKRKSSFFHLGWRPVVSSDGKTMFVGGWGAKDYLWRRVNVSSGESEELVLPGLAGDIIGTALNDRLFYIGLPTTGNKIEFTKNNSPLRGPKLMLTVKATDGKGKAFQTVMPAIDPRSCASFGAMGRSP